MKQANQPKKSSIYVKQTATRHLRARESGIYISLLKWLLPILKLEMKLPQIKSCILYPNSFLAIDNRSSMEPNESVTRHSNRLVWNFSTLFDLNEPLIESLHAFLGNATPALGMRPINSFIEKDENEFLCS